MSLEELVQKVRADFPMLSREMQGKPLVYLDSAATAQKPQVVIDALSNFYAEHNGTVHRAVYELAIYATEHYAGTRSKVRALLNAREDAEIIFTRGTTEAINLVASSYGRSFLSTGDEICVCCIDHHANIVPWQLLCKQMGAVLRVIPVNEAGEIELEEYAKLLGPKTKIVATSHIANSLGTVHPIKKMAAMAHAAGAIYLVDGAQAAPHLPVDVQDLDVDFYAFSGHKVYGPTGVGCLYGRRELLEAMPPYQGGGDMIDIVSFEGSTFNEIPVKFEAGTPAIAQVIGLGTALDYLVEIGLSNVAAWEHELLELATKRLEAIAGLRIIGTAADKASIISFVVEGVHHLDIATMLDLKGIAIRTGHHCTMPAMQRFGLTGTARASFAVYNTKAEVKYFGDCLEEVIQRLR